MLYLRVKYWKSCFIKHGISAGIEKINFRKNKKESAEKQGRKREENETGLGTYIIFKRQKKKAV